MTAGSVSAFRLSAVIDSCVCSADGFICAAGLSPAFVAHADVRRMVMVMMLSRMNGLMIGTKTSLAAANRTTNHLDRRLTI